MSLSELLGMDAPDIIPEEVEAKPQKMSPFDFVNNINYDKKDLFSDDAIEQQYNAYIINRALSFSPDVVIYANEMNRYPHIPKAMQYEFLKQVVRKKKRFDKWVSAEKEDADITLIKEYYNYSNEKAKQALTLLTPNDLDTIRERLNKGGMATQKKRGKTVNA